MEIFIESLWPKFFPKDKYFKNDGRIVPIQAFFSTFDNHKSLWNNQNYSIGFVEFDVNELKKYLTFDDFEISLINRPYEVLGSLGIALSIAIHKSTNPNSEILHITTTRLHNIQAIYPRILNLSSNEIQFSDLKSSKVGQLVSLTGYVVKAAPIRPLIQYATFICNKCLSSQIYYLEDGIYNPPSVCSTPQCRNKYLDLQRRGANTIPSQRIKLQEVDNSSEDSARVPKTFELEARGVLVNCCRVGDVLTVVGVVNTIQLDIQRVTKGVIKDGGLHQLYLVLNSVVNISQQKDVSTINEPSSTVVGPASKERSISIYRAIGLSNLCFAHLCASLCPTIYGQELVKAGLILGLLGGTPTDTAHSDVTSGGFGVNLRSDIHVLVVGDPGLGKSQLLRACVAVATRGILVCGNTSSAAGLTVAVGRDGRDTSIEAGALVLADQGICCVDELDKLTCDYHALLEAMEQQRISVAKGGVVTSLKCRASILAAANPSNGHYQRKKTLCENLKMPNALISRFDIIFLLLDRPEVSSDRRISEHIMGIHKLSNNQKQSESWQADKALHHTQQDEDNRTFSQRLRHQCSRIQPGQELPIDILRGYIDYARKSIHPRLSKSAAKVLQRTYLTLRSQASLGQSIPVTTRHLESLIRLSQARAKAELREEVTEKDANDVVELLQESLLDALTDDVGEVDFGGKRGGTGLAKQVKAIVKVLTREAELKGSKMFTKAEISEIVSRMQIDRDLESLIEVLRTECYLLLKGPRQYQLQTS